MKKQSNVAGSIPTSFLLSLRLTLATAIAVFVLIAFSISAQYSPAQNEASSGVNSRNLRLGKVLSSAYGGQIFGFDVDQNGTDGIIDDALSLQNGGLKSAIETFDIKTGKITKIVKTLVASNPGIELVTFGIGGKDVGFVDEERATIQNGHVSRHDRFYLLNPVTGEKITGSWMPPHPANSVIWQFAQNQTTSTQVALVYRNAFSNDVPWLYVTDLATNKFLNFIRLKVGGPLAQDAATNEAITAQGATGTGPDHGPVLTLINLTTGKTRKIKGFNNGEFGAGTVNGLAVDSNTGIACTTTSLDAQVEFYKLSNGRGTWAQLPGTNSGDELTSGWAVTNDPQHGLFLVAQPYSSTGGSSTIYVYDEKGNLKETINGFNFPNSNLPANFGVKIVINPTLRIGWVNGPSVTQLQQFFY